MAIANLASVTALRLTTLRGYKDVELRRLSRSRRDHQAPGTVDQVPWIEDRIACKTAGIACKTAGKQYINCLQNSREAIHQQAKPQTADKLQPGGDLKKNASDSEP